MKLIPKLGRSRPSYSYTCYNGVLKQKSILPKLFYMLGVCLPMAAAVFLASLQVHSSSQPSTAKQAPATLAAAKPIAAQPIAVPAHEITSQDTKLQSIIYDFVAAHASHAWSIQIQGLNGDDRAASYNSNVQFNSASIFKLLLVYPLSQKTPISDWGKTNINVVGSNSSVTNCVTAMLKISDNDCGTAIGDYIGWGYATDQLRAIGLSSTNLNDPAGPLTTSADTAYYLKGLYDGKWFDGATRTFVMNILSQQTLRGGIPAGCGKACSVANKTGDLDSVRHDAGIVRYKGGAYVLSIFSNGASYSEIAELAHQVQAYMVAN